jgi:hypothetical protein
MRRRRSTGRFGALDWEVIHFCILQAGEVLPDGVQLAAYQAGASPLAGVHRQLNDRRIVVIAIVLKPQDPSFQQAPAVFDKVLRRDFSERGVVVPLLREKLEVAVDDLDCGNDLRVCRQPTDVLIDRHVSVLSANKDKGPFEAGLV